MTPHRCFGERQFNKGIKNDAKELSCVRRRRRGFFHAFRSRQRDADAPVADTGATASTLVRGGHRGGGGVHWGGGGVRRGGGVYRGGNNVVRGGHNVVRGNVVRGGHNTVVVGGRGAWGRGYRWPPGGAIAAGVAVAS